MKITHVITIVFSFAAMSISGPSAFAQAAKCQRSCTEVAQTCESMGGRVSACEADLGNCMKTGSLHMPSGRTFKNLSKKIDSRGR